jgi:hypothetical protein
MKTQNTVTESKWSHVFRYAQRVALSAPGKFLIAAAVMVSLVSVPLLTRADQTNEERKLTGNWMVTVTRLNPPPSLPPTFLSLMTYFEDGNVSEESNTTSIRSTGHGNWERVGHQQFARTVTFFRFDSTRNYLGTGRITATITLSEDGSAFQADAVVQNFDPSGNLLTTLQSTEVGQRL